MSRIARIAGFTILAGATAARGSAQDLRMMAERLERQAELSRRASAALSEYDSPSRAYGTAVDTFLVGDGAIVVLGKRSISSVVRDAAARADSNLRRVPAALAAVRGSMVFVDVDTTRSRYGAPGERTALIRFGTPPLTNAAVAEGRVDADEIARFIEGTTVNRALDQSRSPFSRWRRGDLRVRQQDVDLATDWGAVRLDILSSRSLLGPRCYRGEIPACSMLLGLTEVDDPVMAWYDSLARFDEVKARREVALAFNRADTEACLAGQDAACGRALHTIKAFTMPPASGMSRDALTLEALRIGGDSAAERMLESRGTPTEALAAGAGVPADSVLRSWQRHVRGDSIESDALSWRMALMGIGWVALLFGLSTRISRWR
jgi:hypothetical protein